MRMGTIRVLCATAAGLIAQTMLMAATPCGAQTPRNVAEQYLFQAANAERRMRGLPALQWDESLFRAARQHARQMAARSSISHQYAGEADVAERAETAGARFSVVAENVAEAPTAPMIHTGWMESEHHRDNLLDPRLDRIAIGVLERGGQLYAVEDFERGVAVLSFTEQEQAVAGLLTQAAPLQVLVSTEAARQTCEVDTGFTGTRRPWFVMRFTASELDTLPGELRERLTTGKYHLAEVGACSMRNPGHFTRYNIAVLLYP